MSRETHVRFWERAAVKARRATRLIVFGEAHQRRILRAYMSYYNEARTHLSLRKDAPIPRPIQVFGRIISAPILGGLHHEYCRI
jgi:hypothetical protein